MTALSSKIQTYRIVSAPWQFRILYADNDVRPSSESASAVLSDPALYAELSNLLGPFVRLDTGSKSVLEVSLDEGAPELHQSLDLLAGVGLRPVFQKLVSPEQRGEYFPVRRDRPDFARDSSNWLQLVDAGGDGGFVNYFSNGHLTVTAKKEHLRKPSHCLNLLWCEFAVSEEFKNSFEAARLTGAIFRPLIYDSPGPNCKRRHWIDTDTVAPWCLTPRRVDWLSGPQDLAGAVLKESNEPLSGNDGCLHWDDEGYNGLGITYRKADMDAFDGIDFMRQAEWGNARNGVWRSYHLVSQKFRKWAHEFGCRFRMNGVRLVD